MESSTRSHRSAGFSVLDLTATLGVLALLTVLLVPSAAGTLRTYRRNVAAWTLLTEIRRVQSLAVSRGDVYLMQWGDAPPARRTDGAYRIVRDPGGSCTLPDEDAPADEISVVRGWTRLADDYLGVSIVSVEDNTGDELTGIGFAPTGDAIAGCGSAAFPLRVVLADGEGGSETIEVRRSGQARRR